MKNKIIFLAIILLLAIMPVANLRAETATFTKNDVPAINIYPSMYDNLVFALTIKSITDDSLTALTLKNTGSAGILQINKLVLWADNGATGFQGLGIDKNLGDFIFASTQNYWYLNNLAENISADGLRLFISLETTRSANITANKTVQLQIPALEDYNGDKTFALGETGIFLTSGNNGPQENLTNAENQAILTATGDGSAPKVIITDPEDNATLTNDFTILGTARDSGGSTIDFLQVKIGETGDWHNVENLNSNYLSWQYKASEIPVGTYNIYTQAKDGVGNSTGPSYEIKIKIEEATTEPEEPPVIEEPEPTEPAAPILYKSPDSSTVYFIDNNTMIRRPIFNAVIFEQHGYNWNSIEVKSAETLARYTLGQAVVYATGTLLKFYTNPNVYLVKNDNELDLIPDEETFLSAGYNWKDVKELPDSYLAQYVILKQ